MQIVTWKGAGVGSLVDPFILHTAVGFNKLEPFSIYLENNYLAASQDFNFFKLTDDAKIYTLGLLIQSNDTTIIKTKRVLSKTLFLLNLVGAIDGPYVLSDWNGQNYMLKQQVFTQYETREEKVKIDELENDLLQQSDEGLYVKHDDTKVDNLTYEQDVSIIREDIIDLEERVDTLELNETALTGRVESLENQVDINTNDIVDLDVKVENIEETIDGLNFLVKLDNETITRNSNQEIQVSEEVISDINSRTKNTDFVAYQQLVGDFLNDKLDKKPDGIIDLITPLNKIDARYLDINTELFIVVLSLPAIGIPNKIYLVPKVEAETQNLYDEFIYLDNKWEKLGTITIDLSNYYNKQEVDALLNNKVDKVSGKGLSTNDYDALDKSKVDKLIMTGSATQYLNKAGTYTTPPNTTYEIVTTTANGLMSSIDKVKLNSIEAGAQVNPYTKTQLDDKFDNKVDKVYGKGLSTNDFTNTLKNKLDGIQTGAEVNTVLSVAGKTGDVVLNKNDIGLGNVNNTADLAKPISTATQTALNLKADKTELNDYVTTSTFDMQMLEKLGIKPNGTDLLIVGGMINPLYIDDTSYKSNHPTVNSQAAMLALDVPSGTVVVRLDTPSKELFLLTQLPASTLSNWQLVSSNTVVSVAGRTGAVVLGVTDISGLNSALNLKLDITTFEAQLTQLQAVIATKVDKDGSKVLSDNNYTTAEKNKLAGIAAGAEVNVQSDWNITDTANDAFIKNKPKTVVATPEMTEKVGLNANNELVVKPSSGGYEPDGETIKLNSNNELEATNVAIWRYE